MQPPYLKMPDLIAKIDMPNRAAIENFIVGEYGTLVSAPGSVSGKWKYPGGWWDRTVEAMNLAIVLYPVLHGLRKLPFPLSDALLVAFMRDIEKAWEFEEREGKRTYRLNMLTKSEQHACRMELAKTWGIKLNPVLHEAPLRYDTYDPADRAALAGAAKALAAFVCMCEEWDAAVWPDHPREECDPWRGAQRITARPRIGPPDAVARRVAEQEVDRDIGELAKISSCRHDRGFKKA